MGVACGIVKRGRQVRPGSGGLKQRERERRRGESKGAIGVLGYGFRI